MGGEDLENARSLREKLQGLARDLLNVEGSNSNSMGKRESMYGTIVSVREPVNHEVTLKSLAEVAEETRSHVRDAEVIDKILAEIANASQKGNHHHHHHQQQHPEAYAALLNAVGDAVTALAKLGCEQCGEPFDGGSAKKFNNKLFHEGCFQCGMCSTVITGNEFLIMGESPICTSCSPMCCKCQLPIQKNHINVFDKHYHLDCLHCVNCDTIIDVSDFKKVYKRKDSPCCPRCVTTVFSNRWSMLEAQPLASHPTGLGVINRTGSDRSTNTVKPEVQYDAIMEGNEYSEVADAIKPNGIQIESSSDSEYEEVKYDGPDRAHRERVGTSKRMSIKVGDTTRRFLCDRTTIFKDDEAVDLLVEYCADTLSLESITFWLDAEQYSNFDGDEEEMKVYAENIGRKYIDPEGELRIVLPASMRRRVLARIKVGPWQGLFDEAKRYTCGVLDTDVIPGFLKSRYGRQYLTKLVARETESRIKMDHGTRPVNAVVIDFLERGIKQQRHFAYEVLVRASNGSEHTIYRRYSQFHALHLELSHHFKDITFAPFPPKRIFTRSQTRTVAQKRKVDLSEYVSSLFNNSRVADYPAVARFFRPMLDDL